MKNFTLSSPCSSFLTFNLFKHTRSYWEKTPPIQLLEWEISWNVKNCFAENIGEKTIFASSFLDKNIIIEEMRFQWLFMPPWFYFVFLSHTLFMIKAMLDFNIFKSSTKLFLYSSFNFFIALSRSLLSILNTICFYKLQLSGRGDSMDLKQTQHGYEFQSDYMWVVIAIDSNVLSV